MANIENSTKLQKFIKSVEIMGEFALMFPQYDLSLASDVMTLSRYVL